jgi:LacI family transcriptional regulator
VSVFRFDRAPFGIARERAFCDAAQRADVRVAPGWWSGGGALAPEQEDPRAIVSWLAQLPKPCGVFACCDAWARVVARYAAVARILVPEDIAIVGVDDDRVECELASPGLSSVAVPWSLIGQQAAQLVARGLSGIDITSRLERVSPLGVVARQSSDVLAIDDVLVRNAVLWIQSHVSERLTVPRIAEAAKSSRRRLERRFVAALGRTVAAEVRHARVEAALHLLTTTPLLLPEVACRSGFGTAALLSEEFRSELGVPPGKFRRDWCGLVRDAD